jgi:hypothetical protein
MNEATVNIPWLPAREADVRVARHLGYPIANARVRIVRYVRTRQVRMRGRNAEGLLVYATGHGEIDWDDESIELCFDDLIEANLLPAPGRPEGPVELAWQPADRAIAYLDMGYLVERADWTPEMIRARERGEIKLGKAIRDGLSARGQKSRQGPIEQIPRNDFRSEMVAMKVTPLHSPKVVVRFDGEVGVSPRHLLPNYIGPPWCFIEVDWIGLKPLGARTKESMSEPAASKEPPVEQLTYAQIAGRWGCSTEAARHRVARHKLPRTRGSDGKTLVAVSPQELLYQPPFARLPGGDRPVNARSPDGDRPIAKSKVALPADRQLPAADESEPGADESAIADPASAVSAPAEWQIAASIKRQKTKPWVTDKAKQMKKDDEIPADIGISEFARELASRMRDAAKIDRSVRPVKWTYLKNHLLEWGLWPVSKIKTPRNN